MKKVKLTMLGLASMLFMQACVKDVETQDQEKAKQTRQQISDYLDNNGIQAQWTDRSKGFAFVIKPVPPSDLKPKHNVGDQLIVQYVGYLLNGTIFDRSEDNKPLRFAFNDGTIIPGFNDGVGLMQKGDEADLYLPSDWAFGNRAFDKIPAYSPVWFHVVLQDVLTEDEALRKYIWEKKLEDIVDTTEVSATKIDSIPITIKVLNDKRDTVSETHNMYHITTKLGTGDKASSGKQVTVNYRGLFLNGTEFDKGNSVPFTLQEGAVIKGFLEGLLRMKVGEKAYLLMPSGLGYRDEGSGKVPPYAPLVFEVELLKVE